MTSDERRRAYELFEQALERPPGERPAFLAEACGNDTELWVEVDSLLEHDRRVTDGFVQPAKTMRRNSVVDACYRGRPERGCPEPVAAAHPDRGIH